MNVRCLLFILACLVLSSAASAQTLTCSSDDMGRHFCRANTANGVQMIHQRSGSPCTQGYSWGYDRGGIWVDHGCRADFSLGGGGGYGTSPQDAMRFCKNTAAERLPNVPLAFINVYRGSDTGNGSYMINFRAQPPNRRASSGFCIVARNGQMQNFQFDPGSGPYHGGGGAAPRTSPQQAMQLCKSEAGAWAPYVPLAYVYVNQVRVVGGGGYMVPFQLRPPNGRGSDGFCNVSQGGQVEVWSGGRRVR